MRIIRIVALLGLLAIAATGSAQAQILGYHFSNPAVLVEIAPVSGADSVPPEYASCNAVPPTPVNTLFSTGFVSGLAQRDGQLYGLEWEGDDIYLVTIDPAPICAASSRVSVSPIGFMNLESLAWSPGEQAFYSVDFDFEGHVGRLIRIDVTTGAGELISTTPMTFDVRVTGLVLDGSTLYGVTSGFGSRDSELISIDRSTGEDTAIGFTGLVPNSLESLTVDDTTQALRLLAGGTTLYEINSNTGVAAAIGGAYPSTIFALTSPGRPSGAMTSLVAAVLPSGRSVQVNTAATAFATVINSGSNTGENCGMGLGESIDAAFGFQTTDPATNALTGSPNQLVSIDPGAAQTFLFSLTPNSPLAPTDVMIDFSCTNSPSATAIPGVNTLLFSASASPVPDIIALAATLVDPGIVNIPGASGTGAFAVASVNVGIVGDLTVTADSGLANLPLSIGVCETDPIDASCKSPPSASVALQIGAGGTPTFSVFPAGGGTIGFDPANNRVFVRFTDSGGVVRGATSVAVRTN